MNRCFSSDFLETPKTFLNVAKYDLGKVRLEPMQSAVSPFTVRDLQGGPLEICRAVVSRCIARIELPADRCGSFALYFGESLRILALSTACFCRCLT